MFKKILNFITKRKITSAIIAIVLIWGGYYFYKKLTDTSKDTRYIMSAVEKGTIVSSISGSGQVSAYNQVEIKPKASGDVTYVVVKNGQQVRAGALLAQLNTVDAFKAVRDAEINLENAQISLAKLKLNQQTDSPKFQDAINSAQDNLMQAYQNGYNQVADAFLNLPNIIAGIRNVIYDSKVGSPGQANTGAYLDLVNQDNRSTVNLMINQAINDYLASSENYNKNLEDYKNTSRYSKPEQIISLIDETLETTKVISQAVKDEQNFLDAVVLNLKQYQVNRPVPSAIINYQADISGYISQLNNHISSLNNTHSSITSNQQSLASSERLLNAAKQSDPLDIASQENAVKQRQAALDDARANLGDYSIRAPFSGTITKLNVKRGDSVSAGTIAATILTPQKIAEISLNEIDVAKIKVGQKTTLTFDAIDGLTLTGEVSEMDTLGTVNQGVVTYNLKIVFDSQDDRVKPGMSVSAAIVTDFKQNALLIPNSAVKSSNGAHYVEIPADLLVAQKLLASSGASSGVLLPESPNWQMVETGLSNDSMTEVTSGLKEGDLLIVRTIAPSSATSTQSTQSRSLFSAPGSGGVRSGGGGTNGTFIRRVD